MLYFASNTSNRHKRLDLSSLPHFKPQHSRIIHLLHAQKQNTFAYMQAYENQPDPQQMRTDPIVQ